MYLDKQRKHKSRCSAVHECSPTKKGDACHPQALALIYNYTKLHVKIQCILLCKSLNFIFYK